MADEIAAEVIIVDDDPSIQRALNRLLGVHGFTRRIFSNAQEFLADTKPAPAVGCMLLDVNMPGLSGLELQAELQRRGFCLPIVFLTAHATVPTSVQAMKLGGDGFSAEAFRQPDPDRHHSQSDRPESSTIRGSAKMLGAGAKICLAFTS